VKASCAKAEAYAARLYQDNKRLLAKWADASEQHRLLGLINDRLRGQLNDAIVFKTVADGAIELLTKMYDASLLDNRAQRLQVHDLTILVNLYRENKRLRDLKDQIQCETFLASAMPDLAKVDPPKRSRKGVKRSQA
jgi:hypothetical protein